MFSGGNVTVYVSNMDRAVRFYSDTLGLKLAYRFGDHWASIEAGTGPSPLGFTRPLHKIRLAERGPWRSGCS